MCYAGTSSSCWTKLLMHLQVNSSYSTTKRELSTTLYYADTSSSRWTKLLMRMQVNSSYSATKRELSITRVLDYLQLWHIPILIYIHTKKDYISTGQDTTHNL